MDFGYMRTSSLDQNEIRQLIALVGAGVPEKNIYMDKQSGKDFERKQYQRMVRKLKKAMYSMLRASTASDVTIRKYRNSGVS